MSSLPKVFISATSGDLRSIRKLAKDALLTIGCHPIEQDTFPPDYRTVRAMLRERIKECQALVHIVGLRYGAEPNPATLPPGTSRRSYTQMEYDIGRELQKSRGHKRFRIYTFICPKEFPYDPEPDVEDAEKRSLQRQHRQAILQGEVLFEMPRDSMALQVRIHALREETLNLLAAQQRRTWGMTAAALAIFMLVGFGLYEWLPTVVTTSVSQSLSPEAVAVRFRADIEADFQRKHEDLLRQGQNWQAIRELEQRRDMRLAQVDNLVAVIREGLASDPGPIFTEAVRISEQEGVDAALAYLDSHQSNVLSNVDSAAAQAQVADERLRQALQPLLLKAELHSTQLQWDAALALLRQTVGKAPQWYVARLRLGNLLYTLARYPEAETEFKAALALAHSDTEQAVALNQFALLLKDTNRLNEAEPLMRRALAIDEKSYDSEHPNVARDLNNLAVLLLATNRLDEAEPLMRRALAIDEKSYGAEHSTVATHLNNLAQLLQATNRLNEAEPLMRRALAIDEKNYGGEHPNVARNLNNLALLLKATNRLDEAEPLMRRALAIDEKNYGAEHPNVARDLNNLALLLQATNRLNEAEPLMRRALAIDEKSYDPEHPNVATHLSNLAQLLQATNRPNEAEPLMRRALAIDEKNYDPEHPNMATPLNNLAQLLQDTNRLNEAEPLMRRALVILLKFTHATGYDHPNLKSTFNNYRQLLVAMKLNADDTTAQMVRVAAETGYSQVEWEKLQARLSDEATQ
jgi:tetratricopeptide (TPR) repeat protein